MNKLRLLFFLFLSLSLIPLTSCDDDDDDSEPSRRELLTADQWTAFSVYQNGTDVTAFLLAAGIDVNDITITFNSNGTYTSDFAGDQESGTWEFANNEQSILIDKGVPDEEFTAIINKLDSQELFLEGTIQTDDGPIEGEFRFRR